MACSAVEHQVHGVGKELRMVKLKLCSVSAFSVMVMLSGFVWCDDRKICKVISTTVLAGGNSTVLFSPKNWGFHDPI